MLFLMGLLLMALSSNMSIKGLMRAWNPPLYIATTYYMSLPPEMTPIPANLYFDDIAGSSGGFGDVEAWPFP